MHCRALICLAKSFHTHPQTESAVCTVTGKVLLQGASHCSLGLIQTKTLSCIHLMSNTSNVAVNQYCLCSVCSSQCCDVVGLCIVVITFCIICYCMFDVYSGAEIGPYSSNAPPSLLHNAVCTMRSTCKQSRTACCTMQSLQCSQSYCIAQLQA